MPSLPTSRIVILGVVCAVLVFVCLWVTADLEPTGSRLSLSLLGAAGGLIFGGLMGLFLWDHGEDDATAEQEGD